MEVERLKDPEIYREASELARIGKSAVRAAQNRLHQKGLPIAFSRNGKVFYELPDGEITSISPFETR